MPTISSQTKRLIHADTQGLDLRARNGLCLSTQRLHGISQATETIPPHHVSKRHRRRTISELEPITDQCQERGLHSGNAEGQGSSGALRKAGAENLYDRSPGRTALDRELTVHCTVERLTRNSVPVPVAATAQMPQPCPQESVLQRWDGECCSMPEYAAQSLPDNRGSRGPLSPQASGQLLINVEN